MSIIIKKKMKERLKSKLKLYVLLTYKSKNYK